MVSHIAHFSTWSWLVCRNLYRQRRTQSICEAKIYGEQRNPWNRLREPRVHGEGGRSDDNLAHGRAPALTDRIILSCRSSVNMKKTERASYAFSIHWFIHKLGFWGFGAMLFFIIKYAQYHESGYPTKIQVSENWSSPIVNCAFEHVYPKQELIIVPHPGKNKLIKPSIQEQGDGTTGTSLAKSHTLLSVSLVIRIASFWDHSHAYHLFAFLWICHK